MKKTLSMRNLLLISIPIFISLSALVVFSILPKDEQFMVEGSVEIASSSCFTTVSGTVESVPVQTGQQVQKGDVLAVIDDSDIDDQIEQLRQTLEIKAAQLRQLQNPPETDALLAAQRAAQDNVTICQENLEQAKRSLTTAQKHLTQQQQLYAIGAIAYVELEQYELAVELAQSQLIIAQAQLSAAQNNVQTITLPKTDEQAIAIAQADFDLTQLQIDQLEAKRDDYIIKATTDGVVISTSVEVGATLIAGQSVFKLSNGNAQFFVFYLPQEYLTQVSFGDELILLHQGRREEAARGTVTYIDLQAVYPPEDYENDTNRNKRSVKIKAELTTGKPFAVGQNLFLRLDAVQ